MNSHNQPSSSSQPKLYTNLASWFHLLTAPKDYAEEAAFYQHLITIASTTPAQTMLELGSGGGNNASHLKATCQMTLTDLSSEMLALSKTLNPECEHIQGDMRTLRLGRLFDAVFVHDAIAYMTTEADLRGVLETAYVHCKLGGVALFVPDYVLETFTPKTDHGGHDDAQGKGLRYVGWTTAPDPNDTRYTVDYAYLLREADGSVRVEHDRHVMGLFSESDWIRLLRDTGFQASALPHAWGGVLFLCVKSP
ncbi:MAG: class I SAM-dependent methyltransferase [Chloroflexi bacterium]|nr:class I SAM-dependent methyltransferase [Chloroflexota bacterium]